MVRTRVGYAGGAKRNPTYHDLGDHAETLQVDFDPKRITYEELFLSFWNSHTPTRPPWSRQYMSAIFVHDEEQERLALASRERAARPGREVFTEVAPFTEFYLAEDYHQKYSLRAASEIMAEFEAIYPSSDDFVASTAAARVNGYLAGWGTPEALRAEIGGFGLSSEGERRLIARRGR